MDTVPRLLYLAVMPDDDVLMAVAQYLARCFSDGRSPHIGELSQQLGTTPLALSRSFMQATGFKLGAFLRMQQVIRARRLLRWSSVPPSAVARGCGYEQERTFYRAFRRATGTTPLQYAEAAAPRIAP